LLHRAEEVAWSREAVKWQTLAFDFDAARFRLAESRSEFGSRGRRQGRRAL